MGLCPPLQPASRTTAGDPVPFAIEAARPIQADPPALAVFERPSAPRATWQIVNTLVPYVALLVAMYLTIAHGLSRWATLALAIPASGFLVRLFILMHDCTHSSFLPSRGAERMLGRVLGLLLFTPFSEWQHAHLRHHATAGNLDKRGTGDIWTMTVDEYIASPRTRRWRYRLARNPFLMLVFGPFVVLLAGNRVPPHGARPERIRSILYTDLALALIVLTASLTIGIRAYVLIQLPILWLGGAWGVWLFYVQHQFEPSYWQRDPDWDPARAALEGSSYYRLPPVLQWFSGHIGLHHVHHLRPRIPNYSLQRCLDARPELQAAAPLTLLGSLRSTRLALWDEGGHRFVSFRDLAGSARGGRRVHGGHWGRQVARRAPCPGDG